MNSHAARGGMSRLKAACFAVLFICRLQSSAFAAQPAQWISRGPGGGGAFFAPSFNPYSPGELYLTSDMSDVFHSTNYGASWSVLDFRQIEGNRQAIVQFTSDPKVRYAIDYSNDASTPTRSLDGGTTWQQSAGDPTGGGAFALFADPASTNRVLVSDYTTIYFSTDGGASFNAMYSDANGLYVAGAFFDGTNIYAATGDGLVVSTDNGGTFDLAAVGGINGNNETMFSFAGREAKRDHAVLLHHFASGGCVSGAGHRVGTIPVTSAFTRWIGGRRTGRRRPMASAPVMIRYLWRWRKTTFPRHTLPGSRTMISSIPRFTKR